MGQGLPPKISYTRCTTIPSIRIRLVPGLSIAALKSKSDKELALWCCLRCVNYWGSGQLVLHDAIHALMEYFNYSKSAVYRIIEKGNGIFWEKRTRNGITLITLFSLKKLAKYFNTGCGRNFIEIPVENFAGHGKNRVATQRSWLYASFHKPQGTKANPISRASIQEATGVNRRSQQRYDKVAVKRFHNYANQSDATGKIIPKLEYVNGKSKQWLIQKQLGNTYFNLAQMGRRGMIRKINNTFCQSSFRREAWLKRRFFISVKSYLNCKNRYPNPYISLSLQDCLQNGGIQWCTP